MRRTLSTLSALAIAVPLLLTGPPAVAAPLPRAATRINDVDGDGRVDLVFVLGDRRAEDPADRPRLQVRFADGDIQSITAEEMGDEIFEDSTFGRGLAVGDLNADGCADIIVSDTSAGPSYNGRVWAVWGSADGISAKRVTVLTTGRRSESIGQAVAFVPLPEPVLAVSGYHSRLGTVTLHRVTPSGRLGAARQLRMGSPGIVGTAQPEAGFGNSMAASGDLLVLAASTVEAVYVLQLQPGLRYWATRVRQGSRGVPGTPEEFDGFGTDVSILGDRVAIAVLEGVGRHESAGAVQALRVERTGHGLRIHPGRLITQASAGIPGTVGKDRNFGLDLIVTTVCPGIRGVLTRERRTSPLTVPFAATERCPGLWLDHPTVRYSPSQPDVQEWADFTVLRDRPAGSATEAWVVWVPGQALVTGRPGAWTPVDAGIPADQHVTFARPAA